MKRILAEDIEVKIENVFQHSKCNYRVTVKHPKVHTSHQTFCNTLKNAKEWALWDQLKLEELISSLV